MNPIKFVLEIENFKGFKTNQFTQSESSFGVYR